MTISDFILILVLTLKILGWWTLVSFVVFVIACYVITVLKRNPANQLPPLPAKSILGKHPRRAF